MFHPAMPKFSGGAGNLIYSSEWHQCRDKCAKGSDHESGCREHSQHFYGAHLPFESATRGKQRIEKTQGAKKMVPLVVDKETMTEISLMYNPFKSELKER